MPMRLVVFGGRDFRRYDVLFRHLDDLRPEIVIHGDAAGADTGADVWAVVNGYEPGKTLLRFPAEWRINGVYNPKAGPERNQRMIDEGKPTHGLAFPGGSGTGDMIYRMIAAKVPIRRVEL